MVRESMVIAVARLDIPSKGVLRLKLQGSCHVSTNLTYTWMMQAQEHQREGALVVDNNPRDFNSYI